MLILLENRPSFDGIDGRINARLISPTSCSRLLISFRAFFCIYIIAVIIFLRFLALLFNRCQPCHVRHIDMTEATFPLPGWDDSQLPWNTLEMSNDGALIQSEGITEVT
jgi:hypothetical protein